jgi:hypothetical protein
MYNMYVLRNNIRAGITLFLKLVSQTFLWFAFLFHNNMYYSRVQGRDCIISEISGWNICQGDEWLIKNEEAVKVSFFFLLSTLTIDINIYNYQIRLYVCILCRLSKVFEHQYISYVFIFFFVTTTLRMPSKI